MSFRIDGPVRVRGEEGEPQEFEGPITLESPAGDLGGEGVNPLASTCHIITNCCSSSSGGDAETLSQLRESVDFENMTVSELLEMSGQVR